MSALARGARPRAPAKARGTHLARAGPTRRLGPLRGRLSRRPLVPTLRPRRVRRVPPRARSLRLRVQKPKLRAASRRVSERSGRKHHRRRGASAHPRTRGVDRSRAILSRVRVARRDGGDAGVGHPSSSTRALSRHRRAASGGDGRVARRRPRWFHSLAFGTIEYASAGTTTTFSRLVAPRRLTFPRPPPVDSLFPARLVDSLFPARLRLPHLLQ